MADDITIQGIVGTDPDFKITESGTPRLRFRLASPQRKYNKATAEWTDLDSNWYSVVCFGRLAEHANESLGKGDRILVLGRLQIQNWEKDGRNGTTVQILAESIGHDLVFGTTTFRKPQAAGSHSNAPGSDPWAAPSGDQWANAPF